MKLIRDSMIRKERMNTRNKEHFSRKLSNLTFFLLDIIKLGLKKQYLYFQLEAMLPYYN